MAFLKKLTGSQKRQMSKSAGWREKEALDKVYAVTPVKTCSGHDCIRLHYWHTDYRGNKERASADYDRKTGRWTN